jgi:hypothetical protein
MRKTTITGLIAAGFISAIAATAAAKEVQITRELSSGQFASNCASHGGSLSYSNLGATCSLPNGTKITCSFVDGQAWCTVYTRNTLATKDLDGVLAAPTK